MTRHALALLRDGEGGVSLCGTSHFKNQIAQQIESFRTKKAITLLLKNVPLALLLDLLQSVPQECCSTSIITLISGDSSRLFRNNDAICATFLSSEIIQNIRLLQESQGKRVDIYAPLSCPDYVLKPLCAFPLTLRQGVDGPEEDFTCTLESFVDFPDLKGATYSIGVFQKNVADVFMANLQKLLEKHERYLFTYQLFKRQGGVAYLFQCAPKDHRDAHTLRGFLLSPCFNTLHESLKNESTFVLNFHGNGILLVQRVFIHSSVPEGESLLAGIEARYIINFNELRSLGSMMQDICAQRCARRAEKRSVDESVDAIIDEDGPSCSQRPRME